MLICLCLSVTWVSACSKNHVEAEKRFVHYQVEGKHIWVDRKYNVICYKFGSYDYSCVQNAFVQVGEIK